MTGFTPGSCGWPSAPVKRRSTCKPRSRKSALRLLAWMTRSSRAKAIGGQRARVQPILPASGLPCTEPAGHRGGVGGDPFMVVLPRRCRWPSSRCSARSATRPPACGCDRSSCAPNARHRFVGTESFSDGRYARRQEVMPSVPWGRQRFDDMLGDIDRAIENDMPGSAGRSASPTCRRRRNRVAFGVHAEVSDHYGVSPEQFPAHATTLDYVVAAAGG